MFPEENLDIIGLSEVTKAEGIFSTCSNQKYLENSPFIQNNYYFSIY